MPLPECLIYIKHVCSTVFVHQPVLIRCVCVCVVLGSRTVVHPKARIIAEAGPIIIGEGNLIEEQCEIINRYVSLLHIHIRLILKKFCRP